VIEQALVIGAIALTIALTTALLARPYCSDFQNQPQATASRSTATLAAAAS
jgi:hypothetical protein